MKIGTIGLTASVVIAFSAGLLGPTLWKEIHRPSSVPTDLVRVDLNDLRIMQQLDEERDYLIATGREVDTIDYTAIESRDLYSYQWGVIRGGIGSYIIMTPSSSAALYYIYRDLEHDILKVGNGELDPQFTSFRVNFMIALMGSAMNLALKEGNLSNYNSFVEIQECYLAEVVEGGNLMTYEANCFADLKTAVYTELNLN